MNTTMKQILTVLLTLLACKAYAWYGGSPHAYSARNPVTAGQETGFKGEIVSYINGFTDNSATYGTRIPIKCNNNVSSINRHKMENTLNVLRNQ